jgi:preprotein translocase subunit YajC
MLFGFVILGILVVVYVITAYRSIRERQKTNKELLELIRKTKGD